MSAIKERIFGAVSVMSESDAAIVWKLILDNIPSRSWDDIEIERPDEWDQEMLKDISENPDCREFIAEADLLQNINA
jgi:hypothetical protein